MNALLAFWWMGWALVRIVCIIPEEVAFFVVCKILRRRASRQSRPVDDAADLSRRRRAALSNDKVCCVPTQGSALRGRR